MEEPQLTIKESQESIPSSESKSQSSENDSNEENDKMDIDNKRHSEEKKYDSSPMKSVKSSGSPFTNSRSPMNNEEDDEYVKMKKLKLSLWNIFWLTNSKSNHLFFLTFSKPDDDSVSIDKFNKAGNLKIDKMEQYLQTEQEIIYFCKENEKLWIDDSYPNDNRSLYRVQ